MTVRKKVLEKWYETWKNLNTRLSVSCLGLEQCSTSLILWKKFKIGGKDPPKKEKIPGNLSQNLEKSWNFVFSKKCYLASLKQVKLPKQRKIHPRFTAKTKCNLKSRHMHTSHHKQTVIQITPRPPPPQIVFCQKSVNYTLKNSDSSCFV